MQKHKTLFHSSTPSQTFCDIQHCLRLNDLDEVGDGTHYLDFNMLGLFSFNQLTIQEGVDFWMDFCHVIGVRPDVVTIPPHRPEWKELYRHYDVRVQTDPGCVWSDGNIGGDCTEFYKDNVEIGNIVNPLGLHLDCGFGQERLEHFVCSSPPPTRFMVLRQTIDVLLDSGVVPSNTKQGYVLRKLMRECFQHQWKLGDHPVVKEEHRRWQKLMKDIPRIVRKFPGQSSEFYWQTHGIPPELLPQG